MLLRGVICSCCFAPLCLADSILVPSAGRMNWPPTDPLHCKAATCSISSYCLNVYIKNCRTQSASVAIAAPWNQIVVIFWRPRERSHHASIQKLCQLHQHGPWYDTTTPTPAPLPIHRDRAGIVKCNIWAHIEHVLCGVSSTSCALGRDTSGWTLLYWVSL